LSHRVAGEVEKERVMKIEVLDESVNGTRLRFTVDGVLVEKGFNPDYPNWWVCGEKFYSESDAIRAARRIAIKLNP